MDLKYESKIIQLASVLRRLDTDLDLFRCPTDSSTVITAYNILYQSSEMLNKTSTKLSSVISTSENSTTSTNTTVVVSNSTVVVTNATTSSNRSRAWYRDDSSDVIEYMSCSFFISLVSSKVSVKAEK